jgi:hypothetical protein
LWRISKKIPTVFVGQEHDASAFSDSARYRFLHEKKLMFCLSSKLDGYYLVEQFLLFGYCSRSQQKHVSAQFKRNFEIYTDANLSAITLLSCINDLLVVGGKEESWSLFEYQFYNLTTESFEFKVQESDDFMADAVLIRSNSLACIEPSTRRAPGHVVIESAHSTNFSVSEHAFNTLKHISYAAQDDTIYVTDYYNGTYMSRNGAFNWTHVFRPSLGKLWRSDATVRASVTAAHYT